MTIHYENHKELLKIIENEIHDRDFLLAVSMLVMCEYTRDNVCESKKVKRAYKKDPNHIARDTQENKSQSVEDFFKLCYEDGLFEQERVPIALLYYKYCKDLKLSRNRASAVSPRRFTQILQSIVQAYPLHVSKKRSVVSTTKLRVCNLREFFDGKDLHSFWKESDEHQALQQKSLSIVNPNPVSFLYRYSLNHTDKQLTQLMIELASKENCDVQQIYAISQQELEQLYNRHKDQLSEHLARFNQ